MKNKKKKLMFFLVLFLSIGFFGFGKNVLASPKNVVINEIMYNPEGVDTGKEWIEIFNNSEGTLELTGWILKLRNSSGLEDYMFPSFLLEPKSFVVVHLRKAGGDNAMNLFQGDFPSGNLGNTSGSISLYNTASLMMDFVEYGSVGQVFEGIAIENKLWAEDLFAPSVSEGKSLELYASGNWQECKNNGGTPGMNNFIIEDMSETDLTPEPLTTPDSDPDSLPIIYPDDIIINEIFPAPKNSPFEEFVEFYNTGDEDINLKGWKLKDDNLFKYDKACILPELKVEKNNYAYFNLDNCDASITLSNKGDSLFLFNPTDTEYLSGTTYEEADYDTSWSFDGRDWRWASCVDCITPGMENKFDPIKADPEPKIYSNKITINEILPNPKGVDKGAEYIEFYNDSDKAEDLDGWKWKDRKGAIREFKRATDNPEELLIKSLDFLVLNPQKYKMTLYNKDDFIELLTPDGKPASSVAYLGSAKENLSYGWDGSKWRWSKHLTPGAENVFDDAPNFKVIKDDTVYKNFPANFDVNIKKYKKSKYKITWDFGDSHKSYKKTTIHKYKKKGKYTASVKIFNGSEEVVKTFKVEVKDFPKYDVEIISVNPNPEGSDTDLETLTVKNNSKKKVNLQNWSVATGDKKLTNHPIALKTVLKPKETLTITRQMSKFTLNNKKANVELRYPTGKVASKMKYDKKVGNIAEGEILEKSKLGWIWKNIVPAANVPPTFAEATAGEQETSLLAVAPKIGENLETPQILGESDINANVPPVEQLVGERMLEGGQSVPKNKKDFKIVLASFVYAPFIN